MKAKNNKEKQSNKKQIASQFVLYHTNSSVSSQKRNGPTREQELTGRTEMELEK